MDTLLREWLNRIERKQETHDKTDEETFTEIFKRLNTIEIQAARLLVIVGVINAIGGALLTVAGIIIAKKLGF